MQRLLHATLLLAAAFLLSGCESDAARERRLNADVNRQVAEDDADREAAAAHRHAVVGMELAKQHELDAVEQRRTGNVYAHSCRKAVAVDPGLPVSVDTSACPPEQLRLELEAERRQPLDDAMKKYRESQSNKN